jgi:hypothetical protein
MREEAALCAEVQRREKEEEIDRLERYLASVVGLGSRPRRVGGLQHKIEDAARKSVTRALKSLESKDAVLGTGLSTHLQRSLTVHQSYLAYEPYGDEGPWDVELP